MKPIKTTFSIILTLLFIASYNYGCKKFNKNITSTFTGTVFDNETNQPIPGAEITVSLMNGDLLPEESMKGVTDINGKYLFTTQNTNFVGTGKFYVTSENHFERIPGFGNTKVVGNTFTTDLGMDPMAFINLNVKDTGMATPYFGLQYDIWGGFYENIILSNKDTLIHLGFRPHVKDTFQYFTDHRAPNLLKEYKIPFELKRFEVLELDVMY